MSGDCSLLLVDGNQGFLDLLCRRLYRLDYQVTAVTHPRRALAAASLRRFDIALLGWNLGGENGVELTRHLNVRVSQQRVILLFRNADLGSQEEAIAAGAFVCLSPPCSLQRIEDTVDTVAKSPIETRPSGLPRTDRSFVEF